MEIGESLLRIGGVESEDGVESVRDALDELGIEYEYSHSEPENSYPRSVYFNVAFGSEEEVERVVARLAGEHGHDAEVI